MPKFPTDAPRVRVIKGSTLRLNLRQAEINRDDFLAAYEQY